MTEILAQEYFEPALCIERKRSERSGRGFVLMLLKSVTLFRADAGERIANKVAAALSSASRDTDIIGWYRVAFAIGVIFTELAEGDAPRVGGVLMARIRKTLANVLTSGQISELTISLHVFPEEWNNDNLRESPLFDEALYPTAPARTARLAKRTLDLLGSSLALLFGLPLFIGVAIAVKLTSRGPVLFVQPRMGQGGREFNLLKFRSMDVDSDPAIHREFVEQYIANSNGSRDCRGSGSPYKLTADPRVTAVGAFLRRTSLDELPQFWNVLKGEMSLVGPRPPIPYEVGHYQIWHRQRLMTAKPGITGIWQVGGRSRVQFDEMVRMDLRYASSWSLWLDLKILMQTPLAVLSMKGAH